MSTECTLFRQSDVGSRRSFKDPANHSSVPKSGGSLPAGI